MSAKFTPETRGGLLERTAAGVSMVDACRSLGLREKTVAGWLTRGRGEASGEYAEFARAIDQAREDARSRPEPMDEDELARVVSEMARKGSVSAAKLRWEMLRAPRLDGAEGGDADGDPLAELDELARKRGAG